MAVGYVINDGCVDCGVCVFVCPHGAIAETAKGFAIDWQRCNECGDCAPSCPASAIVDSDTLSARRSRRVKKVLGPALGHE